jgi:hypothetical protein
VKIRRRFNAPSLLIYTRDQNTADPNAITRRGIIKNLRRKQRGIEDSTLKSLRMRGNKSPAPPGFNRPKGRGIKPQGNKDAAILHFRTDLSPGSFWLGREKLLFRFPGRMSAS